MNYLILFRYLGYFACAIGLMFIPSMGWAVYFNEPKALRGLILASVICLAAGGAMIYAARRAPSTMYQREALALVGVSWVVAAGFGALPYILSGLLGPVDAYFESMSGFTTTGSTVLQDIEAAPKSILFWRSLSQWLGGMGIIVLFIAVLPYLGAGGKQLFKTETSGPDAKNLRPHIRDTASALYKLYSVMSVVVVILFMIAGMDFFDALCHTFTTMATGGFSTKQASIAAFDSIWIELITIVFMLAAGVNFSLYFAMIRGRRDALWKDTEWRVYMAMFAGCTLLIAMNLAGVRGADQEVIEAARAGGYEGTHYDQIEAVTYPPGHALRSAAFQTASIMTSTGFATEDFDVWPHFSRTLLVILMFIGGCGGSTAGGFKVIRVVMLLKMAYWRLETSFRPKTVRLLRISGEVVDDVVQRRVSGFFVLYLFWFVVGVLALSWYGLPFQTAVTAVAATMNNIGPGLGMVGAVMDYSFLPQTAKLLLSFLMVLGRLEVFTICVLLVPSFWHSRWTH